MCAQQYPLPSPLIMVGCVCCERSVIGLALRSSAAGVRIVSPDVNAASKVACMGVLLDDFNSATYVLNHHFEFGVRHD